jgi:sodium/hydrogen antiporter
LPFILLLSPLMPNLRSRGDALFLGWFGPIAIAALYYASLVHQELGLEQVWTVVSLVIFASVVVHGMTATPLSRLYDERTNRRRRR